MGDISQHFSRKEFACPDGCGFDAVDAELLRVLEDVHDYFEMPTIINSGCRCAKHNASIEGSSPKSQHLLGKAGDLMIPGLAAHKIADYLDSKYPNKYGIGRYDNWTHIDVRAAKARWDFRKEPVHA